MTKFLAGLVACFVVLCAGYAIASRNSSGTMSASSGPYVAGTVINPATINARYADIESEITDSLSRSGKGGMTAPLRGADGTVAAPSFSWTSETGSGLYRIGASDLGLAVAGSKKHEWTATGETVTGMFTANAPASSVAVTGSLGGTGTSNTPAGAFKYTGSGTGAGNEVDVIPSSAVGGTNAGQTAGDNWLLGVGGAGINTGSIGLGSWTNAAAGDGIRASNGTTTLFGNVKIGASGTAISGSFAASAGWTPGSIAAGSANGTSIAVSGAAAGSPCMIGSPVPNTGVYLWCYVTLNSCNIQLVNPTAAPITGSAGTYQCRVFNP